MKLIRLSQKEIRQVIRTYAVGEIPGKVQDEMAIPTYLHPNPLIRWLFWRRYELMMQIGQFNNKQTVLEFGCGIGMFLPTLCAYCGKVLAIDLFPQVARGLVHSRGLSVTFLGDMDDIPDKSLDLLLAADVMEHLSDPAEWARKFRRKLKPSGQLLVSGPTENIIYKVGRQIAGYGGKGAYHHTNIDKLHQVICVQGFTPLTVAILPFPYLPPLFKVYAYSNSPTLN